MTQQISNAEFCRAYLVRLKNLGFIEAERALEGYDTLLHSLNIMTDTVRQLPLAVQHDVASKIITKEATIS